MKKLLIFLSLVVSANVSAMQLEQIEDIPNTYGYLTWSKYASAKHMREKYDATFTGNPYKLAEDKKKAEAQERVDTCRFLNDLASETCFKAIDIERTSTSAIAPVRHYIKAAMLAKDEQRDRAMALATKVAHKRVNEDAFVELLVEICESEVQCE